MTKRNLIVLIVGIIILLILVGWFSYSYFKNKPVAITPTPTTPQPPSTITFSKEEEKTLSRMMGLPSDQIPGVYKEKVELYKEKLKNDCLSKKENVRQFLMAVKNSDDMGNLLNEMKQITVSMDAIPNKVSPQGKDLGFEIRKSAVLECLNLNKEEFKQCQSKLNGLEINNTNAEEATVVKIADPPLSIPMYLQCKAVEQRDKNLCSKFYFASIQDLDYCNEDVGILNFMTSVYFQPNCENLCQKEKVNIDERFTVENCLTVCQAIKNSDVNECLKLQDKNKQLNCQAYVTSDSSHCQKIEPKILEVKQTDGTVIKEDQVADCLSLTLAYKSIKENKPDILEETKKRPNDSTQFNFDFLNYLKRVYFNNEDCEKIFDKVYENYCNLKYSP